MKKAIIGGAVVAALVVVLKELVPDIMRYLRIRRM